MEQNERSTRIPAQHFIPSGLCIFPGTLEQEERRPRVGARRRLRRQRGGTNNVRPMAPPFHFTRLFFPFLARRRKRKSRESKQETHNQACCRFHAVYALGFFFGVEEKNRGCLEYYRSTPVTSRFQILRRRLCDIARGPNAVPSLSSAVLFAPVPNPHGNNSRKDRPAGP
jgi:hypothetical protein